MTQSTWQEGLKSLYAGNMITLDDETYWYFLGTVPPLAQDQTGFVCGEPYTHNSKNQAVCLTAIKIDEKYYAKLGTVDQFNSKETFNSLLQLTQNLNR